tara:strand:- start:574 stop:1017 length:444 start_codon:yes stop_codon:yes gene_type:complete
MRIADVISQAANYNKHRIAQVPVPRTGIYIPIEPLVEGWDIGEGEPVRPFEHPIRAWTKGMNFLFAASDHAVPKDAIHLGSQLGPLAALALIPREKRLSAEDLTHSDQSPQDVGIIPINKGGRVHLPFTLLAFYGGLHATPPAGVRQ